MIVAILAWGQLVGFVIAAARGKDKKISLWLAGAGGATSVLSVMALRECLSLGYLDVPRLVSGHRVLADAGGMSIFLLFLVGNGCAIAWCFDTVRRGLSDVSNGERGKS